jgi:hypothetical protein
MLIQYAPFHVLSLYFRGRVDDNTTKKEMAKIYKCKNHVTAQTLFLDYVCPENSLLNWTLQFNEQSRSSTIPLCQNIIIVSSYIGAHKQRSRYTNTHSALLPILHKMGMNFIQPFIEFLYIHLRHFVKLVGREDDVYPLSFYVKLLFVVGPPMTDHHFTK